MRTGTLVGSIGLRFNYGEKLLNFCFEDKATDFISYACLCILAISHFRSPLPLYLIFQMNYERTRNNKELAHCAPYNRRVYLHLTDIALKRLQPIFVYKFHLSITKR